MQNSKISHWRQCNCITLKELPELTNYLPQSRKMEEAIFIILTHSCSLSIADFEKEPEAEYIVAKKINDCNPQYMGRRHPRELHLPISINGKDSFCSLHIHERGFFDRKLLDTVEPSTGYTLSKQSTDTLIRWITARYNAPAFPDELNRRFRKTKDLIAKKLSWPDVTGVYAILEPETEEIVAGQDYYLEMVLTMDTSISDSSFKKCRQICDQIRSIISKCDGVVLQGNGVSTIREDEITVADLRSFKLMQFDYLSERESPGGKLPTND